jgi:diguanylate cyclase (GGDEF)-like protein/PAS domain S-box-containing protein
MRRFRHCPQSPASAVLARAAERSVLILSSVSRYRRLFETARDGILLLNADTGQIEDVNPYLIELLGYSHAELLGKKLWEAGSFEHVPESKDMLLELQAEDYVRYEDLSLETKAGVRVQVEFVSNRYECEGTRVIQCNIRDITERKIAAETILRERTAINAMLDSLPGLFYVLDDNYQIQRWNKNLEVVSGYASDDIPHLSLTDFFDEPDKGIIAEAIREVFLTDRATVEADFVARGRTRIPYLFTGTRVVIDRVPCLIGMGIDITVRRQADRRIRRLNRVYAVLSGINTLIVRVRIRDELFREACRIAVEQGQFKMAWIGVVNPESTQIVPIATAGVDPEFLAFIKDRFSLSEEAPQGNTLVARAIREKTPVVSNDIRIDPRFVFLKERGIYSIAALPLLVSDEAFGVLVLYADEAGFFDEEEMKLLTELAGDIGFALDHIHKEERLNYLAFYDEITDLPNRTLFLDRIDQLIRACDAEKEMIAVALIDIDRFRIVNDTLGHKTGDELLKLVAQRIQRSEIDCESVARVGVNCFGVAVRNPRDAESVALEVEKLLHDCFAEQFRLRGSDLRIVGKAGIAICPLDGLDAATLFRNAEAALRAAKDSAEPMKFCTPEMNARVIEALDLESRLRAAIELDQFALHYQPKISMATGKLTGVEALLRWNDPRRGLVPPLQFIPILEETGLIHEVGRWALRKAIEDYLRWSTAGLAAVRIAVNVSSLQMRNPGLIAEIGRVIGVDARAAAGLELEITESLIMDDVEHSVGSLRAIRAMGVKIAIDDFGTGFSSLSYLAKLPVDTLKIDRSFVIGMTDSTGGWAIVSTIINLAHSLRLNVIAEGVETEEQARMLRLLNCDEMQGFLFGRPLPSETFEARFLSRTTASGAAG